MFDDEDQPTPGRDGNHAAQGEIHDTMTFSADERKAGRIIGPREVCEAILLDIQDGFPSSRTSRCTMLPSMWWNRNALGISQLLLVLLASIWITPTSAAFVEFTNCLSEAVQNNAPLQLQLIPMFVNAVFNDSDPSHNLNVTVYTNVTGSLVGKYQYVLPNSSDSAYWNSNDTSFGGKIENIPYPDGANKYTTLDNKVTVLTYEPYSSSAQFCEALYGGSCPLGPTFNVSS